MGARKRQQPPEPVMPFVLPEDATRTPRDPVPVVMPFTGEEAQEPAREDHPKEPPASKSKR